MHSTLALAMATALGLALAGCIGGDESPATSETGEGEPVEAPPAPLPENISAEETVVGATPVSGLVFRGQCASVAAGTCYRYDVVLDYAVMMSATLEWAVATNDFDLFLIQDDNVLETSDDRPPSTEESLYATLEPGQYELIVAGYLVAMDTFTLDAIFTST